RTAFGRRNSRVGELALLLSVVAVGGLAYVMFGQQQVARLYRMTDVIGLIAGIAPMLGLLGTVVGMVGAFDTIAVTEGPVRPDALAGNISEALITTVLGLIVAIPATAVYTYLRNRIDALAAEAGEIMEELAVHLEGGGDAAPAPRGGGAGAGPGGGPGAGSVATGPAGPQMRRPAAPPTGRPG
ncbi:MAG: MotA/TolQ/ExbB proton channel family protein, partial [Planctomycetota bacterium]